VLINSLSNFPKGVLALLYRMTPSGQWVGPYRLNSVKGVILVAYLKKNHILFNLFYVALNFMVCIYENAFLSLDALAHHLHVHVDDALHSVVISCYDLYTVCP